MKQFLEVESAHYKKLGVFVAGDGNSRVELYNKQKRVDTIYIHRWKIEEVRVLMSELGLERDEKLTYDKIEKAAQMAQSFGQAISKEDL